VARFRLRLTRINYALAAAVAVFASIAIIVRFAEAQRRAPARCPAGLEAEGARCCGSGQVIGGDGICSGGANACAQGMSEDETGACVLPVSRIHFAGGSAHFGATDWEGALETARDVDVDAFDLDQAEVTIARFRQCSAAGKCPKIPEEAEPGRPVRNVSAAEATAFCAFASGYLPSSEQWLFAAAGSAARHYPWGNTGLVCRRASFGLVHGPCAQGGVGPDFAGARPDGATPEGVLDMAGNVAEWTREKDGSFVARGGSYRSEHASDLKTTAFEPRQARAPYIGFRCAYAPVAVPQ
jgi:formylglycine-generating enzyme required for sulfatase activity